MSAAPRIDFERINAAALSNMESLLCRWLPGGRVNGSEYVCGSVDGGPGGSCSTKLATCVGGDFSTEARWNDPVSLYAAIHNLKMGEAARKLAGELGIDPGDNGAASSRAKPAQSKADEWRPVLPVPDGIPDPDFKHFRHGLASAQWAYRDAVGRLLGYVCRFNTAGKDGQPDKEICPLTFCQNTNGQRAWRFKGFPEPRPLYGLDVLAASKPDAPVLLVEGEKSADAAQRLVPGAVCMTWPNGSKSIGKADFTPLAGRRVAIWPDADKPGFEAALALAARVKEAGAVEVSIIAPPDGAAEGWDSADAEAEGWDKEGTTAHIKAHKMDVAAFGPLARERYGIEAKATPKAPRGWFPFKLKADGVYFLTDDGDADWLCSPLAVRAMTRDDESREWGRLLEVVDSDGTAHRWAMPMSALAGDGQEYRRELLSMGLRLASGKGPKRLHDFLTLSRPEGRARCVSRVGWQGRRFVLPDGVHGPQDGEEVILQGGPADHAFRVSGSLAEWQEAIGRYCPGNSRLVLAVAAALAAPLLALAGAESGGFHLVGGSSTGKTTALKVAGSVCGGGGMGGYCRTWRATDNALESTALAHCDAPLCLDEMGQVDAKTAAATAYMLANGAGKGRANKDSTGRKVKQWRVLVLSTGEITLADKIREDGRGKIMAGQAVRFVDIPADAGAGLGAWEELHGFENGNAFSDYLREFTARVYGSPLRVFLDTLTGQYDEAVRTLPALLKAFIEEVCPPDADGQVKRVAGRFGLVAAAGELGTSYGVLPWAKGEARQAAARCFRDWLDARGGSGAAEVSAGIAQVRAFLEAHGSSRFEDLEGGENQRIINRVGFRQKSDGHTRFCIFPEAFKREVCAGLNEKTVCAALLNCGALLPESGRHTRNVRTPEGLKRFFVVTSAIFAGNTGNTGNSGEITRENLFPLAKPETGTPGTEAGNDEACSHCSHLPGTEREQIKSNDNGFVPTVPTVPTQKHDAEGFSPVPRQSRVVL